MLITISAMAVLFFLAWTAGANNAANVMGIPVGSGVLSIRNAVIIVFVLEFYGAVFFGGHVADTVGLDIVTSSGMRMVEAVAVVFVAGVFMFLASYFKIPVSMAQVLVGCVIGYGLATSAALDLTVVTWIAMGWLFSPFIGILLGFVGYYLVNAYFLSDFLNMAEVGRSFRFFAGLEIFSAALIAFAQGANNISAIVGVFHAVIPPLEGSYILAFKALGGLGIGVGMATWGYRVMKTISSRIVALNPAMCFASELSAAIIVLFFTFVGLPVSSVHVVVGTVVGVGLISGAQAIHKDVMYEIAGSWIFVVPVAAVVSMLVVRALLVFV